jgi:hypothetical protein
VAFPLTARIVFWRSSGLRLSLILEQVKLSCGQMVLIE